MNSIFVLGLDEHREKLKIMYHILYDKSKSFILPIENQVILHVTRVLVNAYKYLLFTIRFVQCSLT